MVKKNKQTWPSARKSRRADQALSWPADIYSVCVCAVHTLLGGSLAFAARYLSAHTARAHGRRSHTAFKRLLLWKLVLRGGKANINISRWGASAANPPKSSSVFPHVRQQRSSAVWKDEGIVLLRSQGWGILALCKELHRCCSNQHWHTASREVPGAF